VCITGTEKTKAFRKDKLHINYIILVKYTPGMQCIEWLVPRRYSRFKELHDTLKKQHKADAKMLPKLPATSLARNFKPEYLERKSAELTAYLTALLRIAPIRNSVTMNAFLSGALPAMFRMEVTRRDLWAAAAAQHKAARDELLARIAQLENQIGVHHLERMQSDKTTERAVQHAEELQAKIDAATAQQQQQGTVTKQEFDASNAAWESKVSELKEYIVSLRGSLVETTQVAKDLHKRAVTLKAQKKVLVKEVRKQMQINLDKAAAATAAASSPASSTTSTKPVVTGAAAPAVAAAMESPTLTAQPAPTETKQETATTTPTPTTTATLRNNSIEVRTMSYSETELTMTQGRHRGLRQSVALPALPSNAPRPSVEVLQLLGDMVCNDTKGASNSGSSISTIAEEP
jgi:hypothetical protein